MITGKIKNQVDAIWMSFWTGGITNSIDVLEQMTYLFFMKMVDDAQLSQEAKAAMMGMGDVELPDAVFKKGLWHNPDTNKDVLLRVCAGASSVTSRLKRCSTPCVSMSLLLSRTSTMPRPLPTAVL